MFLCGASTDDDAADHYFPVDYYWCVLVVSMIGIALHACVRT